MEKNILTLNLHKTKAMVFGTRHTLEQLNDIRVKSGDVAVDVVQKMKYLGIILDSELKFSEHTTYLKHKLIG